MIPAVASRPAVDVADVIRKHGEAFRHRPGLCQPAGWPGQGAPSGAGGRFGASLPREKNEAMGREIHCLGPRSTVTVPWREPLRILCP